MSSYKYGTYKQAPAFASREEVEGRISGGDAPGSAGMRSAQLSRKKKMLDMKDGDSHWTNHANTIGPYNDMYLRIKMMSIFPYPFNRSALIENM